MNDAELASMIIHGAYDKKKSIPTTTTTTTTTTGIAISDSSNGKISVKIAGQTIGANSINIPCIGSISKGSTVIITVTGVNGRAKSLIAIGSIGAGDSTKAATTSALNAIEDATTKIVTQTADMGKKINNISESSNPQLATFASLLVPTIAPNLSIQQIISINTLLPEWRSGTNYKRGEAIIYKGDVYRIAQAHTSQDTWLPTDAPSLYTRIRLASDGVRIWAAPTNAEDSFSNGERVHYPDENGDIWISNRDGNTSVPGTDRWWEKEAHE